MAIQQVNNPALLGDYNYMYGGAANPAGIDYGNQELLGYQTPNIDPLPPGHAVSPLSTGYEVQADLYGGSQSPGEKAAANAYVGSDQAEINRVRGIMQGFDVPDTGSNYSDYEIEAAIAQGLWPQATPAAPSGGGGQQLYQQTVSLFQGLLDLDRDDISAPASGLEATIHKESAAFMLGDDDKKIDLREDLIKKREVTTLDQVVDPLTGRTYASPADARKSGITNWIFKHEQEDAA